LTEARFRKVLLLFAVTLAIAGAWTLMPDLVRAGIRLPADQNDAASPDQRRKAALAARVGMVRGDLWADLFFTFGDAIVSRSGRDFGAIKILNEALPAAQRTLAYAPFRSDVWLLLAVMAENHQLQAPSTISAITMSYYTAPYMSAAAALRLSVATRGSAIRDPELRQIVEHDLQVIFASRPQLRSAVVAAYATASAEGKHLIESTVRQVDPAFLMRPQSGK
jgi:hypothetical protein